jgi:hypothetical protein
MYDGPHEEEHTVNAGLPDQENNTPNDTGHVDIEAHREEHSITGDLGQQETENVTSDLPDWLTRDYYESPWMLPTIWLSILQILFLTFVIFWFLSEHVSALKTLVSLLLWILMVQPFSCYMIIVLGLWAEREPAFWNGRLPPLLGLDRRLSWFICALLIFASYSISPIWQNGLFTDGAKPFGLYIIMFPTTMGIFIFYASYHLVRLRTRRSENIDRPGIRLLDISS